MSRPLKTLLSVALLVLAGAMIGPASAAQAETTVFHEGEEFTLQSAPDRTVSGETPVAPGETVLVRMQSSSENPFIRQTEVTVAEDGTFTATFDMGSVPAGTEFELTVLHNGTELTSVQGRVVECRSDCEPTSANTSPTDDQGETTVFHEGEELSLESAPDRTISGETPVAPGETLLVRMRSSSENPFIRQTEATVAENGSFTASVDMGSVPAGTEFELTVVYNDSELTSVPGRVVECSSNCEPTSTDVSPSNDDSEESTDTETMGDASNEPDSGTIDPITSDATETSDPGLIGGGAIAFGGLLAVVGMGLLLGLFRG